MQIGYFDAGIASVYVGQEQAKDWGIRSRKGTTELWMGKTYLCVSTCEPVVKRVQRKLLIAAMAFGIGWIMEPPHLSATDSVEAVKMERTVTTLTTVEALSI